MYHRCHVLPLRMRLTGSQQLFSLNRGDVYLPSTLPARTGTLFWSVTRSNAGNVIIKVSFCHYPARMSLNNMAYRYPTQRVLPQPLLSSFPSTQSRRPEVSNRFKAHNLLVTRQQPPTWLFPSRAPYKPPKPSISMHRRSV